MAAPVTSGTVNAFPWDQRRILDHSFRRAGLQAEMAAAENILVGQELLSSVLAEWVNAGFPLWTRQYVLLGCQIGWPDVACPAGTVDVIHAYWRTLNPWRGGATLPSGADGSILFGGVANPDVTIAGPNPYITVNFATATEVDTIGVLLGTPSSVTTALQVQTSADGIAYTTVQTLPSATYTSGSWVYFDLGPSIKSQFVRLLAPIAGAWVLNQINFGLANASDIEAGPLNIDDYYNLPNKFFQGDRAVSVFVDRQVAAPVIKLWPTVNSAGFYNGVVPVLLRRYIQDPGSMTNAIEIPTRAVEALIWRLASMLAYEIADKSDTQAGYMAMMQKQQRMQMLEQKAGKAESLFWAEERNKSPINLVPNIRPYTA